MRFLVMVKASEESESGAMPTEEDFATMGRFNEEMVNAGVMRNGEGLTASADGARIHYSGGKATVIDGPFTEAKELVAGFWLLEAGSKDEVVSWMKRAPFVEGEVEIRQIAEMEDFGDAMTPELRAQEERLRAKAAGNS